MKKRFSEEQIIGFLREADAGMAVKELCRRHGFHSTASALRTISRVIPLKMNRWNGTSAAQ
jgi:hypothetical protein